MMKNSMTETIGSRIAKCRNCSQAELAERMTSISGKHYSRELVAKWETDQRKNIKCPDLIVLCKALGCTPNYLLGFEEESVKTIVEMLNKKQSSIISTICDMFSELVDEARKGA